MSDTALNEIHRRRRWSWVPGWLFAPEGRYGRADFLYALTARGLALALLVSVPLAVIVAVYVAWETHMPQSVTLPSRAGGPLYLVILLLTFADPVVRRLHDLNLSGLHAPWLGLALLLGKGLGDRLNVVPFSIQFTGGTFAGRAPSTLEDAALWVLSAIPGLLALGLIAWPGTKGPNRYGKPKPLV